MTVDEALAVIETGIGPFDHGAAVAELLDAARVLADYVREHRPAMPHAQRGRTVDHAVELVQSPMGAALVSVCGGLGHEWKHEQIDVDALPLFDPTADDACKTCTRRLPAAIRPPLPTRPTRTRQPDRLAGFELWPTVLDSEYAIELADVDTSPAKVVETFGEAPTLTEIVDAARSHRAKVSP